MKARKAIVFFSFLLLVIYSAGYYIGFKIIQQQVRAEFKHKLKAGIQESSLTVLSFSTEEYENLSWQKKNEFLYKGKLFDIVKQQYQNGKIIVSALADTKEKQLFEGLNEMVNQDIASGNAKSSVVNLGKFFSLKYLSFSTIHLELPDAWLVIHHSFYRDNYCSPFLCGSTPPPDCIL